MFLAILQWKRVPPPSNLPLETFFESLTTAIRYVRYTAGIKILLIRHALFSFFISITPSLIPVIALQEFRLQASSLGYVFTTMAVGSVLSGVFIIPWARAKYSPQRITTGASALLNLLLVLGGISIWTKYDFAGIPVKLCPSTPDLPPFLVFAALAGAGWTVQASELWVASQRAMPDWARGRMNATTTTVAQGATALGGAVWGLAAHGFGIVPTFLGACRGFPFAEGPCRVVPALLDRLYQEPHFRAGTGGDLPPEHYPKPTACTPRWPGIDYCRVRCSSSPPKRMHGPDARSSSDLFAKWRIPVATVRGPAPAQQIPHGSCGALLEATPVAERAVDEERKGRHR